MDDHPLHRTDWIGDDPILAELRPKGMPLTVQVVVTPEDLVGLMDVRTRLGNALDEDLTLDEVVGMLIGYSVKRFEEFHPRYAALGGGGYVGDSAFIHLLVEFGRDRVEDIATLARANGTLSRR